MNVTENSSERDALEGRQLGEFIVHELIGQGGFGAVYRAEQPILARDVVIKVIRDRHHSDPQLIERFTREARLASRLEHPYTASVYAFGVEPDGLLWIAMELVRGISLDKLLKLRGPVPLERFVSLMGKICEVVQTAHEAGIIHRDLKPANVMVLTRAGRLLPKLLDFGVAKRLDGPVYDLVPDLQGQEPASAQWADTAGAESDDSTIVESPSLARARASESFSDTIGTLGSPHYMPMEQWDDASTVTAQTDIYALGVMSYEILTGKRPFVGSLPELVAAHRIKSPPSLGPSFPPRLDVVLAKAMAKEPSDRYPTAVEFASALREATGLAGTIQLPQLNELLREALVTGAPQPIAEAVANLGAARNPYQARDHIVEIGQAAIHYLGALALACRVSVGSGASQGDAGPVKDALRLLGQKGLGELEWLELTRELCHPFCGQREAYPVPELVSFFYEAGGDTPSPQSTLFEPLLELRQTRIGAGKEAEMLELIGKTMPQLAALLQSLAFLSEYRLMVPRDGPPSPREGGGGGWDNDGIQAEQWMGALRTRESASLAMQSGLEPGKPVLADLEGQPVLSLWPLAQVAEPTPGEPEEIFFFTGKGRHGAKLVAFPSGFEIQDEDFWGWFGAHLLSGEDSGKTRAVGEETPYPGLSAFSAQQAGMFFGRERETDSFLNRLRVQPLLAVVGPSGAGKSSFVQAGVVPGLGEGCRVISMRPGASPLAALAARLAKEGIQTRDLRTALEFNPESLGNALRAATEGTTQSLVLIVDQFEELFTLCLDPVERRLFAEGLAGAARSAEDPVRVIFTLRDDYLMRVKELPVLGERFRHELLITPTRDDLLRVLVEPARRAGYQFEDSQMPVEMVEAVLGSPGALPLLAFTAAKLWELRDRQFRRLRRKTYESMGGVGGALERHAEETLAQMSLQEQKVVREAFRRLVTSEGTRAVLTRSDLSQVLGGEAEAAVLEKLVSARLLEASEGEGGVERIEVIHEALLSAWPRLVNWRLEDVGGARLRDQLQAAARAWQDRGRPKGLLWRDEALLEYELWRPRYPGKLTDVEEEFASASSGEATRGRRQRRVATALALILLLIMSGVFYWQSRQTKLKVLSLYQEQGRQELLAGKLDRSIVYLSESYRGGNDNPSLRFLMGQAMQQFVSSPSPTLEGHKDFVLSAAFSPDGKRIVTGGADRSAKVWEVGSGKLLRSFDEHKDGVRYVDFSPEDDGKRVVSASFDGTAQVWESETGKVLATLAGHKGAVNSAVFSPDGRFIVTGGLDRTARIWEAQTGKILTTLEGHEGSVNSAAYSSDGRRVVTAGADNTAKVWDSATGKLLLTLSGHQNMVNSAVFSPDGHLILTASSDNTAKVWESSSGQMLRSLDEHTSVVNSADFSPDGLRIITAGMDRTARIWEATTGKLLTVLNGHDFPVEDAAFSRDGRQAVTASQDQTAKVWNVSLEGRSPREVADIVDRNLPVMLIGEGLGPNPHATALAQATLKEKSPSNAAKMSGSPGLPSEISLKSFDFETIKLNDKGEVVNRHKGQAKFFSEPLTGTPPSVPLKGDTGSVNLDMVSIPEGTFLMGAPDGQGDAATRPQHNVTLSPFYIGKFEVTQAQWQAIMGNNPSSFKGDDLPVDQVNWYDAMEYCARLSQRTGRFYRLPTEAQWEYACRGGTTTPFAFGDTIMPDFVNYDGGNPYASAPKGTYRQKTTPVGSLAVANGFGLFDVQGNMFEWCLDIYHDTYDGAPTDGSAWTKAEKSTLRLLRGGSWFNSADRCRSGSRYKYAPESKPFNFGFRVVLVAR